MHRRCATPIDVCKRCTECVHGQDGGVVVLEYPDDRAPVFGVGLLTREAVRAAASPAAPREGPRGSVGRR